MSTSSDPLAHLNLGQHTTYPTTYQPNLLQSVPRQLNRTPLGVKDQVLPFIGSDRWWAYEISWLRPNGMPQVVIGQFEIPAESPNLIESKSFKLYLNSFNETQWQSQEMVEATLAKDLSACAGAPVRVTLMSLSDARAQQITEWQGIMLDTLDINVESYDYDPSLLKCVEDAAIVSETLVSNLLKSNCLITNQPDWGSVKIEYQGPQLDHASVLRYLISFRRHNEFHEQCVERIFIDIMRAASPQHLSVQANYTRRGGLDINPFRSTHKKAPTLERLARQ